MISAIKEQLHQMPWVERLVYGTLYHYQTACYVVSYPKSGRTWLRTMMGYAMAHHFGLEMALYEPALVVKKHKKPAPYVRFIHDGVAGVSDSRSPTLTRYKNKQIILLVRDPRDVLISYYFHRTSRLGESHQLDHFLNHADWGIGRQLSFLNRWYNQRGMFKDFLLVKYESLQADAASELQRIFTFLSFSEIGQESIDAAVSYASFERMKARAWQEDGRLRPTNPNDPNSHKVREGKVGGYKNHLNEQQISLLDSTIKTNLNPDFGY